MEDISLNAVMLFGYMSLGLVAAAFARSQLPFLQRVVFPSSFLAGFLLLLLGPNVLNLFNIPLGGQVDTFVYVFITALFAVLGLRGFTSTAGFRPIAAATALITKGLILLSLLGAIFTLLLILILKPNLFSAFGSLLMLGFGFDDVLALFFGGFWEQEMAFIGGRGIAFSFSMLGFLLSYILGLILISWQSRKAPNSALVSLEGEGARTGFPPAEGTHRPSGRLTTHAASVHSLSFHLALVGFIVLVTLGLTRLIGFVLINALGPEMVIVSEIFVNFSFLIAFLLGIASRKLMIVLKIWHLVDGGFLGQLSGVLVDYMVVGAIMAIPLFISAVHGWEILLLALLGGLLMLFMMPLLAQLIFGEENLMQQAAFFGLLTGNVTSGVALLRVVDPWLESPVVGQLAWASLLSLFSGIPLFFIINIPAIGSGVIYLLYAAGATLLYGALWFLAWRYLIRKDSGIDQETLPTEN